MAVAEYIPRLIDGLLDDLLPELPAILLSGPRASGKTTTARRRASDVLALDLPAVARAVSADPDAAIVGHDGSKGPLCIDEWQVVPEILGAVKRAVDRSGGGGRFLLTGSVAAELGPDGWPATGRVVILRVLGLCEREVEGRTDGPSPVDVLFGGDPSALKPACPGIDVRGYVSRALRGGFPELRVLSERARDRWLEAYVAQAVRRDAPGLGEARDPALLLRYLRAIAINTAGVVQHKTLYDAAQIARTTALRYDGVLEMIHLAEQVPAFATNRLTQLTSTPKRLLLDASLLGPLANVDERRTVRDADLLGRVIDTFVAAQLRAELVVSKTRAELHHLRDANGRHEVDFILAAPDGRVVGIEVKASAAPRPEDARHLLWLRDRLGEDFICGVVMHTGPLSFGVAPGIAALPISCLWS